MSARPALAASPPRALQAGPPLPYGHHCIEADDIAAVSDAMGADLLAQGPRVAAFEAAVADVVGAEHGVACSSGTSALQLALMALGVGEGDTVVAPTITFLSTATAARLCGAEVIFADVDPLTGLMTPETLAAALSGTERSVKAALPVHLGGRMADMAGLAAVAEAHGCFLIEDAAHALGSSHAAFGRVGEGRFSRATTFSFHPVKTIACGEGGLVAVNDAVLAERLRRLRNHGVTRDAELMLDAELSLDQVGAANPWSYEQLELGLNARMTDLEAALGLSQLTKLQRFKQRRRQLAESYDGLLAPFARLIRPVEIPEEESACLHLYQLQMDFRRLGIARAELMRRLHARGIGTQVHYIPVHRQPYFVGRYGRRDLPGADAWYGATLSLPLFPAMQDEDPQRVVAALETCLSADAGAL